MMNSNYNVSENAANNAAGVDFLGVCRSGNRKKCVKYFGTWFGDDSNKAVEAIDNRLEMLSYWQQNLVTLQAQLKRDIARQEKIENYLAGLSDAELDDFLASKSE